MLNSGNTAIADEHSLADPSPFQHGQLSQLSRTLRLQLNEVVTSRNQYKSAIGSRQAREPISRRTAVCKSRVASKCTALEYF